MQPAFQKFSIFGYNISCDICYQTGRTFGTRVAQIPKVVCVGICGGSIKWDLGGLATGSGVRTRPKGQIRRKHQHTAPTRNDFNMTSNTWLADLLKARQAEAKDQGETGSILTWGATPGATIGAAGIGDARRPKQERSVADDDLIDKHGVSISGDVLAVARGQFGFKVTIAPYDIVIDPECVSAVSCDAALGGSGAVYGFGVQKLPRSVSGGAMQAMPYRFSTNGLVAQRLDSIITIEVSLNKNGPNTGGLTDVDLKDLKSITFNNVCVDHAYSKSKKTDTWYHSSYPTARSIDWTKCKRSKDLLHPRNRTKAFFEALESSSGTNHHVLTTVCDHIGTRTPQMIEMARNDATKVADKLQSILDKYADAKIGVGQPWETYLLPHEGASGTLGVPVLDTWHSTIKSLKDRDVHNLSLLARFTVDSMRKSHVLPLVQYRIEPTIAQAINRDHTGVSMACGAVQAGLVDLSDPEIPFNKNGICNFTEVLLRLDKSKALKPAATSEIPNPVGLTEEEAATRSLGSIAYDVACFTGLTRESVKKGFNFVMPKLTDGTSAVIKQILVSCKRHDLANAFGVYSYAKTHLAARILDKYLPYAFFTSDWGFAHGNSPDMVLEVQPSSGGDYGGDAPPSMPNLADVAGAVEVCGVKVTIDFLKEYAIDKDTDEFIVPPDTVQYINDTGPGQVTPPQPPKLETNGYMCLNGLAEISIRRTRKVPERTKRVDFYVIYDGCTDAVASAPTLNSDAAEGAAFLVKTFGDELQSLLVNKSILYAIAVPEESQSVKKRERDVDESASVKAMRTE